MDRVPQGMDREGEKRYVQALASEVRANLKRKYGPHWGEKPKPMYQRVGAPMRQHDDEPVWYDLKTHPMGSTIRSEAPDAFTPVGGPPPGVTTTVPVRDAAGEIVYETRTGEPVAWERFNDGKGIWERGIRVPTERRPKQVEICCHSGQPVADCCPWILTKRAQDRAILTKLDRRAARRARGRKPVSRTTAETPTRVYGIGAQHVTKSDAIDPYGRVLVGSPGQLRAEARRHGKYISRGPGAE